jgi:hypothetical protein
MYANTIHSTFCTLRCVTILKGYVRPLADYNERTNTLAGKQDVRSVRLCVRYSIFNSKGKYAKAA